MKKAEDAARTQAMLEHLRKNREILDAHLKVGDVLTHTRCMGGIEEHAFTSLDGVWLCGTPTHDTRKLSGLTGGANANAVNDISPGNVTHVNRVPLENLPFMANLHLDKEAP